MSLRATPSDIYSNVVLYCQTEQILQPCAILAGRFVSPMHRSTEVNQLGVLHYAFLTSLGAYFESSALNHSPSQSRGLRLTECRNALASLVNTLEVITPPWRILLGRS